MEIVDTFYDGCGNVVYTVNIFGDAYVDVKHTNTDLTYVLEAEDGTHVFSDTGDRWCLPNDAQWRVVEFVEREVM